MKYNNSTPKKDKFEHEDTKCSNFFFFGDGGPGEFAPAMGREFFIILLFEKHIFNRFFHGVFVGWPGGGCVFEHPPNVRTRFIAFALWGVGGNAEVGWPCVSGGRIARNANRMAIISAFSRILFVWVVGWGMRFRTPPKCADAVYCVCALGGGRKRRGGMAVCLKCRIASSANRMAISNLVGGLSPNKHRFFGRGGRLSVVG